MKFKNKNKTFIYNIKGKKGEFRIDNHYNIISGKYKGKHYRDILKECNSLSQVYEFSKNMALLEVIK